MDAVNQAAKRPICHSPSTDGKYLFFLGSLDGANAAFWVDAGVIDRLGSGSVK